MKLVIFLTLCILTFQLHLTHTQERGRLFIFQIMTNNLNNEAINGINVLFGEGAIFFNSCNVNIGTYTLDGTVMTVGKGWATTGLACDQDIDQDLINLIQSSTSFIYNETEGLLVLANAEGTQLTLQMVVV